MSSAPRHRRSARVQANRDRSESSTPEPLVKQRSTGRQGVHRLPESPRSSEGAGEDSEEVQNDEQSAASESSDEADTAMVNGETHQGGKEDRTEEAIRITKLKVTSRAKAAAQEMGKDEVKAKATNVVRMALFSEQRRVPLRREDLVKKVLGKEGSLAFPIIFNRAQKVLRNIFGYELVELRLRGTDNEQLISKKTDASSSGRHDDEEEHNKRKGNASKTWVLRSILPPAVIEKMASQDESLSREILQARNRGLTGLQDPAGIALDWRRAGSELGSMGLLYLVLSLILVNGRSLPDDLLRSHLRRLALEPDAPLPSALQPHGSETQKDALTLQDWLQSLIRHSYLECIRSNTAQSMAATHEASLSGKRTQARGLRKRREDDLDIVEEYEWRWGARSEAEITEKAVAEFIAEVTTAEEDSVATDTRSSRSRMSPDEQPPPQNNDQTSDHVRRRTEQVLRDVERAAGSALIT